MTKTASKKADSAQEKGTNIQVVVRCRDLPEKSSKGNPLVVVAPEFGMDVHTRNLSLPEMQRHQFDGVFGPQATQEQVYDKVARPILEEVMQGYSCTIFAYGQTSTGKTHTMEGDLEPASPEGSSQISTNAGLIPRTLHNLFYLLDMQSAEYKVYVSYVELYNEDLRDLLSSGNFGNGAGLKLLDPGHDKSVVIHGLEEKRVVSAQAAVELLQAGAKRRKVAATRCNDESSRSHAIFTIRVEILERDISASGQVIEKLGKLNLVDLAGSENVRNSGADSRETKSINKSLLALAMVIEAVSGRSGNDHIPYRNSKLTQMLRDSLGGHTRTCMIATIKSSPDSIAETMSTLRYATHARGIANRPTVTKNVVHANVVNSMQATIDKLTRELQAARTGQGFHIPHEMHKELIEGIAQANAKAEGWKGRMDTMERALEEVQAQKQQLEEQRRTESLFARAHAHHEQELGMIARQLRSDLVQAHSEGALLHAKTVRLAEREHRNVEAAAHVSCQAQTNVDMVLAQVSALEARVADGVSALLAELESRIGSDFERTLTQSISTHTSKLHAELERIAESYRGDRGPKTDFMRTTLDAVDTLAARVTDTVKAAVSEASSIIAAQADNTRACRLQLNESRCALATTISQALDALQANNEAAMRKAEARSEERIRQSQTELLEQQRRAAEQIASLRQQVVTLQAKALQAKESAIQAFAQMLSQNQEDNDNMLSAILSSAEADVDARNSMSQTHVDYMGACGKDLALITSKVLASTAAARDTSTRGLTNAANADEAAVDALVHSADSSGAHTQTCLASALQATTDAHSEAVSNHNAIRQELGALGEAGASAVQLATTAATETAEHYNGTVEVAVAALKVTQGELANLAHAHTTNLASSIADMSATISGVASAVEQGLADGVQALEPSGQTPTRLAAQRSPATWNITLPHEDILARLPANEHADNLFWTGEPACLDEVLMADAESTTDVEPMDVVRPMALDSAPRKRPSDSAISPRTDSISQRPTRRPRTRTALDHSDSATVDENDPPVSLAPPIEPDLKLVSAIPMPRRARRARN
ncbi:hypothetical protein GGI20_004520 [Coemansia sp. BCRC 34301]|nr:hypothetical protein GGI20_004520 [Coemansia sp. BCRC 34301]